MIGSIGCSSKVRLHEFVRRADHRRLVTRLPAYLFDTGAQHGICYVPEVPRHQKIDAVGDGDMRRIVRGLPGNRATVDQRMRETLGIRGRIEKHDRFERLKPEERGIGIARSGFRDNEGRCNEIKPVRGGVPPLPGDQYT